MLCAPGRWPRRRRAQWPSYRGWLPKLSTLNRQKPVAPDSCAMSHEIRLQHSGFRDVRDVESARFCGKRENFFCAAMIFLIALRC